MRPKGTLVVSLALGLGACTPTAPEQPALLAEPFEAGVGLGELRLGETTYVDCVLSMPSAKKTFSGSDDGYTVEIYWPQTALRLEFPLGRSSLQTLSLDTLKNLTRDAETTALANPAIGKARLGSITFGSPHMSDDPDGGHRCGGMILDGQTHESVQIGMTYDEVVSTLGEGSTLHDPVLPLDADEEDDARPRYRVGDFSMRWEGLTMVLTKPRGSDPHRPPRVTSLRVYLPRREGD